MSLRTKILLLALLPLLLVALTISVISYTQARSLSEAEIQTFEETLLASKQEELRNYVELAMDSIAHTVNSHTYTEEQAKQQVKTILNSLTYGEDCCGLI